MRPLLPAGSRARVTPCAPGKIRSGDIVVFRAGRTLVVHRVVAVRRGAAPAFAERGDAALTVSWRPAQAVVGRVDGVWLGARYLSFAHGTGRMASTLFDARWRSRRVPGRIRLLQYGLAERALLWLARRREQRPVQRRRWRVVDQIVEVSAPGASLVAQVEQAYGGFPRAPAAAAATVEISCDGATVRAGARRSALLAPPWSAWHLRVMTNQAVLSALAQSHMLPHGSAVQIAGRAALLVGGSGSGKTTLALALHDRGFQLLAEGQVPIDAATGLVQPFPRGLDVVVEAALAQGSGIRGKTLRPAPKSGALVACPIGWIFFLEQLFPGTHAQRLEVGCPAEDRDSMRELFVREGLVDVEVEAEASIAVVAGDFTPTAAHNLDGLHRQLRASGLTICFVASRPLERPDFSAPLAISPLAPARTILALAANSIDGDRGPHGLSDLARLVEGVSIAHFTGGSVAERVRAVEEWVGEEGSA